MSSHRATFYLQLEPTFGSRYDHDEAGMVDTVREIKAVNITQKRPASPRRGVVIAKLPVEVPDSAFLPLRPTAIVVVPESLVEGVPIEVEAEDANEPPTE